MGVSSEGRVSVIQRCYGVTVRSPESRVYTGERMGSRKSPGLTVPSSGWSFHVSVVPALVKDGGQSGNP